jgi:hypothetical protein
MRHESIPSEGAAYCRRRRDERKAAARALSKFPDRLASANGGLIRPGGLSKNAVAMLESLIGAAGAELVTSDAVISHVAAVSGYYDRLPAQSVMTVEVRFMISARAEYGILEAEILNVDKPKTTALANVLDRDRVRNRSGDLQDAALADTVLYWVIRVDVPFDPLNHRLEKGVMGGRDDVPLLIFFVDAMAGVMSTPSFVGAAFLVAPVRQQIFVIWTQHVIKWSRGRGFNIQIDPAEFVQSKIPE